ncbi:MFS transporter [Shimazuella sp. AN120528]|uniref:MFS transporter n=1 Tax=Shimazuella soli TaxID=1892854 RepID=UPI001F1090C6|nr:MFS transporter [Shimazuella soli]MCH5583586.1 MFS transporter [Shimazuella soli]
MNSKQEAVKAPSLIGNRFVQTILLSNILLQIGIWVRNFAILLYVADKTHNDPYAVSLISVAEFSPIFVFSFIGGTFADRWMPRKTMIWCDLLSAVSVFLVLSAIHFGTWQLVYFVTFISAILSQFSQPSGMRLIKEHVPEHQLQQMMALFQSLMATFSILGPMLGTFCYSNFGLEISIMVMGIVFLFSALVLIRLPKDKIKAASKMEKNQFRREFMEGFRYVWKSPLLRTLGVTFALAGLAVGMIQALNLFIVTERLGQSKDFLQYMLMVSGGAMLIGGGVIAVIAKRIQPQYLLAFGMATSALCTVIIGYSTSVPLTLTIQFINGLIMPCIHIGISTMILKWSHASIVGRVNGLLNPMFIGMMVLSMSFAGALKSTYSLVSIYTGAGMLLLIGALVMIPIMKYKSSDSLETNSSSV